MVKVNSQENRWNTYQLRSELPRKNIIFKINFYAEVVPFILTMESTLEKQKFIKRFRWVITFFFPLWCILHGFSLKIVWTLTWWKLFRIKIINVGILLKAIFKKKNMLWKIYGAQLVFTNYPFINVESDVFLAKFRVKKPQESKIYWYCSKMHDILVWLFVLISLIGAWILENWFPMWFSG